MSVKIRLKRMGKIRAPFYRVVVMDSRAKRDGRAIEEIGKYHPTEEPSLIEIDGERAQYWLRQGAQPTETVAALLKVTGDWQQAKGLDGGEGTLRVKADKTPKRDLYEAALAAAGGADDQSGSAAPRKKAEKKADAPKADAPAKKAEEPKVEKPKTEKPKTEKAPSDASAPANEDGTAPEGYTIKGNQDSMKFHEPDGQWFEQTVAEVWFKTAADAEAAGFVKAGS